MPQPQPFGQSEPGPAPSQDHGASHLSKKRHHRSRKWLKKIALGVFVLGAWAFILYLWYTMTNDTSMQPPQ